MTQAAHWLVVEGEADKKLIARICKKLHIQSVEVKPTTPEELEVSGRGNGKAGVYQSLEDFIPDLFDVDKPLKKLAVMVDADQTIHGEGFAKTLAEITARLAKFDYTLDVAQSTQANGLVFSMVSEPNLPAIGVWIMPNNQDDGAIESWIKSCSDPQRCHLLAHAEQTVSNLPNRSFTGNNLPKAEVATWLAWQKKPSIGLYAAVPLLDEQAQSYQQLVSWLKYLFSSEVET
ncbi:MAG: DUF3226 domain-containing protein [Pseudomonadota bacterium]|nr:DUF3226 domain-containing protein [Pseudomonadota bacterium]